MNSKDIKEGGRVKVLGLDGQYYDGIVIDKLSKQCYIMLDDGQEVFVFNEDIKPVQVH